MAWAQWIILSLQACGFLLGLVAVCVTKASDNDRLQKLGLAFARTIISFLLIYLAGGFSHIFGWPH